MSLDLNKLENKLDEALTNETSETLSKFLNDKRMTNNKQQTAVEWLAEQMEILHYDYWAEHISKDEKNQRLKQLKEQAKEMEKKIMIDAIIICEKEHYVHSTVYPPQFVIDKAEQYYNNKYENDKQ